jgi:hypothetical protein
MTAGISALPRSVVGYRTDPEAPAREYSWKRTGLFAAASRHGLSEVIMRFNSTSRTTYRNALIVAGLSAGRGINMAGTDCRLQQLYVQSFSN